MSTFTGHLHQTCDSKVDLQHDKMHETLRLSRRSPLPSALGGRGPSAPDTLRQREGGAALNDAGRCRGDAQGKEFAGERSGLTGLLLMPAGSNVSSRDAACSIISSMEQATAIPESLNAYRCQRRAT